MEQVVDLRLHVQLWPQAHGVWNAGAHRVFPHHEKDHGRQHHVHDVVQWHGAELAALNAALNAARVRRITAETAFRNASTAFVADQSTALAPIMSQRADLQSQYEEKSKIFKADYPAMRELQAKINQLDATIKAQRAATGLGR